MLHDRAVRFGVVGVAVAALCCATPVLAILLTALGIGWAIGYLDFVLLPALFFFAGLTVYALWKQSGGPALSNRGADCDCRLSAPRPAAMQGDEI